MGAKSVKEAATRSSAPSKADRSRKSTRTAKRGIEKEKDSDPDSTQIIREIQPDCVVGEMLKAVPLFAHLTQSERDKLAGALDETWYDDGDVIFTEGDHPDAFYMIKQGKAQVTKLDPNTNKHVFLIELSGGDHFGEQAILANGDHLMSVIADGALVLWSMPKRVFKALFKANRIDVQFATRDDLPLSARGGVSAEATIDSLHGSRYSAVEQKEGTGPLPVVELSSETQELVLNAIHKSLLFQTFENEHKCTVATVMYQKKVKAGENLIVEGTEGNTFYVIEDGEFDVYQLKGGRQIKVDNHKTGSSFGELALMYDAPRNATVVAVCDSTVRVLERVWFNRIAQALGMARLEQYSAWLKKIELLAPLTNYERNQIAEALEVVDINGAGVDVFRQGDPGDAMFIVVKGEIVLSTLSKDKSCRMEVSRCRGGQYFGERALINNSAREVYATTTTSTRLVKLDREAFVSLLGPLEDILKKKVSKTNDQGQFITEWRRHNVKREDLKLLGVLGQGSYGAVSLVQAPDRVTYALKMVSKQRIVETKQKDHIYNEKNLMAQMDHPFLIHLYNTYQDKDRLYFLLEPSLGGELFPILRRHKTFPPHQAKFYAAQVVLAFEYMHKRDFIYRDLKPENLLLDNEGYLKITDFGFCKRVTHKTWTMCGTPEYMAPEIIVKNGHGRAVDWWTIGIFIFEMLASYTPFFGKGGNMKMYERIVRGTFNVPSHISQEAKSLIRGLLRTRAHMRLGMLKEGADGIKRHPWFHSFDWQSLLWRKLKAPLIPKVKGITDVSNFKQDIKPIVMKPYVDDGTNWDEDF